jgi:hypothetical protein
VFKEKIYFEFVSAFGAPEEKQILVENRRKERIKKMIRKSEK